MIAAGVLAGLGVAALLAGLPDRPGSVLTRTGDCLGEKKLWVLLASGEASVGVGGGSNGDRVGMVMGAGGLLGGRGGDRLGALLRGFLALGGGCLSPNNNNVNKKIINKERKRVAVR